MKRKDRTTAFAAMLLYIHTITSTDPTVWPTNQCTPALPSTAWIPNAHHRSHTPPASSGANTRMFVFWAAVATGQRGVDWNDPDRCRSGSPLMSATLSLDSIEQAIAHSE
jgi:hypothetical protein